MERAEALQTRVSTIDLIGLGDCRITVIDELYVTISGQGNVHCAGNPPVVIPNLTRGGSLIPI